MNPATEVGVTSLNLEGPSNGSAILDAEVAVLVPKAQQGDGDALAQIYSKHFDSVYAYLRVALNDDQEAEDAAQQVFTKVLESLASYEHRGQPFRAWLFRIARNQAIDHLRKHGRVDVEEPATVERRCQPTPDTDLRALHWTSDNDLMTLVERLPNSQRQVVVLRYVLDFTTSEIGEILERSPEAVRQLQSRALRFLERRLMALGREPYTSRRRRRLSMRALGRRGLLRPAQAFTLAR
jgi:RNA polymerase sigma-70 factor (ECF subfamily)